MSLDISEQFLPFFGRMVQAERKCRGLSQEHFAELTGLHRNSIQKIEQGRDNMLFDSITAICLVLGVQRIGIDFRKKRFDYDASGPVMKDAYDETLYRKLGMMLETLRKEQHLSREKMSHQTGIHRNTIARIENGSTEIRVGTLLALYGYFRISEVRTMPPELLPQEDGIIYGVSFNSEKREEEFNVFMTESSPVDPPR